jgi:hypothetical protein
MTPSEAFMATLTEVLCQILQTQQQIAQQMNQGPPHGPNHEGPNQVTTYAQFIAMKPPTFAKAEDPLEAEAWIKAIVAKNYLPLCCLAPRRTKLTSQLCNCGEKL